VSLRIYLGNNEGSIGNWAGGMTIFGKGGGTGLGGGTKPATKAAQRGRMYFS